MWTLPPLPPGDTVLQVLTYVALTAQAMTAALAAGRRSMDWAGVCMLGCITALGGGTIRDVLLGHYPLVWVQNPLYLGLTAVAAFAIQLRADAGRAQFGGAQVDDRLDHPLPADEAPGREFVQRPGQFAGRFFVSLQLGLQLRARILAATEQPQGAAFQG